MSLIRNISEQVRIDLAATGATAATSQVDGVTLDMAADGGYDGVIFFGRAIATANAGNFMQVQQGNIANMSDAATIAGSRMQPAAGNDFVQINIPKVQDRYIRVNIIRAGASTVSGDVFAIRYRAGGPLPVLQTGANRLIREVPVGYVEGTP